jgi:hypothetical protein
LLGHLGRPAGLPALFWKNLRQPFGIEAAERRLD